MSHPFGGPHPWARDSATAVLQRRTNKSSLAKEPAGQKNMTAADMIPLPCGRIIDEMIMVQKLRGNEKTIAEVAVSVISMGLYEGTDSHRHERIDVVLDVYRDNSKNNPHEREERLRKRSYFQNPQGRPQDTYINGDNF